MSHNKIPHVIIDMVAFHYRTLYLKHAIQEAETPT